MAGKFDPLIVEGPIRKAVWKLAWPTMLQNVVAGIQGIVDHTMIGHFVGYIGNAAVGVSWQIFLVVIVFIVSIFSGMGILVARFAGAKRPDQVNRVVFQGFLLTFIMIVFILAPVGLWLAPHLLEWIQAEPAVREEALPYLKTLFLGCIGLAYYFMVAGSLRACGDARTPLTLGILMTGLNLVLSVILIRGVGPIPPLGTLGAALGTVLAGALVAGLALFKLLTGRLVIGFGRVRSYWPEWSTIREIFRFGLPSGFQGIAMNLGGILLLRFVGSLPSSAEAQAAYTVAYTQLFSLVTWTSVGLMSATSAVVGQNLGAKQTARSRQAAWTGALLGLGIAAVLGTLFVTIPDLLLRVFGIEEPLVLALGKQLLWFLSLSGLFVTVALTFNGALQGTGDTKSPLVITIVSQLVIPIGFLLVVQSLTTLEPYHVWSAILIGHILRCVLSVVRFHQEKWLGIRVALEEPG